MDSVMKIYVFVAEIPYPGLSYISCLIQTNKD